MVFETERNESEFVLYTNFEDVKDHVVISDGFPYIVVLVAAYLLIVLKIGPDFMKNREPYQFKNTILWYNAFQVILSAYMTLRAANFFWYNGIIPERCCEEDPEWRREMLSTGQIYLISKFTELLDTVFFILRKKFNQVSFLHVYHHSTVIFGTWMLCKYGIAAAGMWTAFINSLVHVVMYLYYFLAALGPQYQKYLTWKKHITTFQLTQFISIILYELLTVAFSKCQHTYIVLIYTCISSSIFYILFMNFYNKSYTKPKKASNGIQNGAEVKAKEQ